MVGIACTVFLNSVSRSGNASMVCCPARIQAVAVRFRSPYIKPKPLFFREYKEDILPKRRIRFSVIMARNFQGGEL
jgi:hypothetical protein